jgi:hypothetical protein
MSQNTPPTPPLARPTKAKGTTEKVSKLRKLTDEQIPEYARKLIALANSGAFPRKTISLVGLANRLNISQPVAERVYIRSSLQKQDYELVYDANSVAGKRPYVDARGMLMLPKSLIAAFNKTAPADKQLTIGQPVDATFEDGKLILTPGT